MRAARTGCVFTDGAVRDATTCRPRSRCRFLHVGGRRVADHERAAVEFMSVGLERLFRGIDRGVLQAIAQRGQRDVGIVVHEENGTAARDAALRTHLAADALHRRVEHFQIDDSRRLHVVQLAKGPAGVVIRRLLRIVRAPVLIIEQRVGNAAVRLIHAHDVPAGRERSASRFLASG